MCTMQQKEFIINVKKVYADKPGYNFLLRSAVKSRYEIGKFPPLCYDTDIICTLTLLDTTKHTKYLHRTNAIYF